MEDTKIETSEIHEDMIDGEGEGEDEEVVKKKVLPVHVQAVKQVCVCKGPVAKFRCIGVPVLIIL